MGAYDTQVVRNRYGMHIGIGDTIPSEIHGRERAILFKSYS